MATTHQKVEQGARSREALLDAAIELIADGGYTATGVDAIARRSGVVKSALYWHFGSKDGLLIAALERTAREWVAEFEAAVVIEGRARAAAREPAPARAQPLLRAARPRAPDPLRADRARPRERGGARGRGADPGRDARRDRARHERAADPARARRTASRRSRSRRSRAPSSTTSRIRTPSSSSSGSRCSARCSRCSSSTRSSTRKRALAL